MLSFRLTRLKAFACACVFGYGIYSFFAGDHGFIAHQFAKADAERLSLTLKSIEEEREILEKRVALIRTSHLTQDKLEELVYLYLGEVHPEDLILITP